MESLRKKDDASAIDFQQPERPLKSLVLTGGLGERVGELLNEWRQAAKLLRYGLEPRNRVLLYGPSGNGKSALASAIATELRLPLGCVQYSTLISKWCGDTHPRIARVFREAAARPCVLFFDEADSLCSERSSSGTSATRENNLSVNTMLLELDRLSAEVTVIFATNLPDMLDAAMRRRVSLSLEMPAPTIGDLRRLVKSIRRQRPLLPLDDFDVASCGATSFAQCEQMAIDHCRRIILQPDFDPLGLADRPRSAWLREQVAQSRTAGAEVMV